jgi:hypothetical protein
MAVAAAAAGFWGGFGEEDELGSAWPFALLQRVDKQSE